jgi:hypothetical protein
MGFKPLKVRLEGLQRSAQLFAAALHGAGDARQCRGQLRRFDGREYSIGAVESVLELQGPGAPVLLDHMPGRQPARGRDDVVRDDEVEGCGAEHRRSQHPGLHGLRQPARLVAVQHHPDPHLAVGGGDRGDLAEDHAARLDVGAHGERPAGVVDDGRHLHPVEEHPASIGQHQAAEQGRHDDHHDRPAHEGRAVLKVSVDHLGLDHRLIPRS